MPFVDPAALVAAFDNARTNDAEHDAALALRDYVAGLADGAGEGDDDDALEHFPFGEGFGDFDAPPPGFYTRPRHVLEGRAELRQVPLQYSDDYGHHNALARDDHVGTWLWAIAGVAVFCAVVYLLAFAPQHNYAMDSDNGLRPAAAN